MSKHELRYAEYGRVDKSLVMDGAPVSLPSAALAHAARRRRAPMSPHLEAQQQFSQQQCLDPLGAGMQTPQEYSQEVKDV
jgi:hypothetical protein